jgi:hypothetical protein
MPYCIALTIENFLFIDWLLIWFRCHDHSHIFLRNVCYLAVYQFVLNNKFHWKFWNAILSTVPNSYCWLELQSSDVMPIYFRRQPDTSSSIYYCFWWYRFQPKTVKILLVWNPVAYCQFSNQSNQQFDKESDP